MPASRTSLDDLHTFFRKMKFYTSLSIRVQGHDLMDQEGISADRCREVIRFYRSGNEMPGATEVEKLAACFQLQRYLCKWGGETLPFTDPDHRAWRVLMLETAWIDPVPLPDTHFGRDWNNLAPEEKEAVLAGIREELANTEYKEPERPRRLMNPNAVYEHMQKHHAFWIKVFELLGGEYPNVKGAKEAPPILRSLMDAGVDCFIDLTEEGELEPYAHFLEGQEHLRFPIRDVSVPRSKAEMQAILDAIDARLESGKSVYVHCWGGIGRTGTVAGCWLARHGEEDPLQTLHAQWVNSLKAKRGKHSPETEEQRRFVLEWKAGE